jgi:small-conductance mechanosensitive channel
VPPAVDGTVLFGALLRTLLPAAALAGAFYLAVLALVRRENWSEVVRGTLLGTLPPIAAAAFLGIGAYGFDLELSATGAGELPSAVSPPTVLLLVELVLLWTVVAAATKAVRRHLVRTGHAKGRLFVYLVYGAGAIALVFVLLASPEVPRISGDLWTALNFLTALFVTYLVVHIVDLILGRYFDQFARRDPQLQTIYTFVRRAILAFVALIGVVVATFANYPAASGTIASLVIAAGFLSIVIGLAAQSSISNVFAGALLALSQPFRIGDAVVFQNEFCFVEDIQLVFSVLRTWDNRRLMVPNSMFQSQVVINYTKTDPTMLAILSVTISYDSDAEAAMEILRRLAEAHPSYLPAPGLPVVQIMQYTERGVDLRLLSRAVDQSTAFTMEKELLRQLRAEFDRVGIRLAVPTRRVFVEGAPRDPRSVRRPSP